jgi:hypothetical protein
MKRFLSLIVLLAYCCSANAQKIPVHAVPKTVFETFKKSHPTAFNQS